MKAFPHLTRPTPPYTQIRQTAWGLIFRRGPRHMRKCGVTHLMRKCGATMRATVSPLTGVTQTLFTQCCVGPQIGQGQPCI